MTTRQQIHHEVDQIGEENLPELERLIKQFVAEKATRPKRRGVLSKIMELSFDGPEDLSVNFDAYKRGEKRVDTDLR